MAKRYSTNGLNIHRSYTPEEAGAIIDAARETILRWIKIEGLPAMTSCKPFLIKGADLKSHIEKRNNSGKGTLDDGQFKCFTCGERGRPLGDMADYVEQVDARPRLVGLCGSCEGQVSMFMNDKKLRGYRQVLDIAIAVPH